MKLTLPSFQVFFHQNFALFSWLHSPPPSTWARALTLTSTRFSYFILRYIKGWINLPFFAQEIYNIKRQNKMNNNRTLWWLFYSKHIPCEENIENVCSQGIYVLFKSYITCGGQFQRKGQEWAIVSNWSLALNGRRSRNDPGGEEEKMHIKEKIQVMSMSTECHEVFPTPQKVL